MIPVSSFLRLRAWRSPKLNEESGFAALFDWLRTAVLENATELAAAAAHRDLGFVQEQLRLAVAAEQQVLAKPEASAEVVGRCGAGPSAPASSWSGATAGSSSSSTASTS